MKILIISYHYWPNSGPRSFRWRSLACHWASSGHDVSVITGTALEGRDHDYNQEVRILRIPENLVGRLRHKMTKAGAPLDKAGERKSKPNKAHTYGLKIGGRIAKKLYEIVIKKLQWPDFAWTWIRNAQRATIAYLNANDLPDVIISVSHPFSSHFAGAVAKKKYPHIKWIMDCGDPFCFLVESPCNNLMLYKKLNHRIERKFFELADWVSVTTPETKERYEKVFSGTNHKIKVIPPMLGMKAKSAIEAYQPESRPINTLIKLVYVGTLYGNIRNPIKLIELLQQVSCSTTAKLEMHFVGPIRNIDRSMLSKYGIPVYFHGEVSHDAALKHLLNSDILVNIGNSTKYQLPSKLVEYVGTGKPILNIASRADDSSEAFLSSYPMAKTVCLAGDVSTETIEKTILFLETASSADSECRDSWLERYSTPKIASEYEELFIKE